MPFRRFQSTARHTVMLAHDAARRMHSERIGTEHLLLGVLEQPETMSARILNRHGLTYDKAAAIMTRLGGTAPNPALDAEALSAIGIDIDAVRDKLEATFGKGVLDAPKPSRRGRNRLMLGQGARKVLALSLREAIALHHNNISDGHLVLAMIRGGDDLALRVLREAGIDSKELRAEIVAELS
jgi:ATP-dependent Clp protease ATP-binding subunit ClpA